MIDCSKLPGHLKAICTGEHRQSNGRPYTESERADIVGRFMRVLVDPSELPAGPFPKFVDPVKKSDIGTKLHAIIERDAGKIECGDCRDEVSRLNLLSPSEVREQMESIATGIVDRGKRKAPKFWQRWGAKLAPGVAYAVATGWIEEALSNGRTVFPEGSTQFVWFYVSGPDAGLELKLSMASLRQNFIGESHFTVIGEKPSWYDGHMIPLKQFTAIRDVATRMSFRDTQHKIMECAKHLEIDEKFVWMMDDCFMLKPTSIEQIAQFRYDPWYKRNSRRDWHQLIGKTFDALAAAGKSTLQAGTHLPHVFEKAKLKAMFEIYGFPQNLLLFEILYENTWQNAENAIPYGGNWKGVQYPQFLRRLLRPLPMKELDKIDANFLNYQSNVWQATMRDWLKNRFSED